MSRHRRCFTEAVKKQIAARQRWQCNLCFELLSAAFEVDHTVPLWNGGEDKPENASALCANCHAEKTQNEAIERNRRIAKMRQKRRKQFEQQILREEESKRAYKHNKVNTYPCLLTHFSTYMTVCVYFSMQDGTITCHECHLSYWPLFPHVCQKVKKRVAARLGIKSVPLKHKKTQLFSEFFCAASTI